MAECECDRCRRWAEAGSGRRCEPAALELLEGGGGLEDVAAQALEVSAVLLDESRALLIELSTEAVLAGVIVPSLVADPTLRALYLPAGILEELLEELEAAPDATVDGLVLYMGGGTLDLRPAPPDLRGDMILGAFACPSCSRSRLQPFRRLCAQCMGTGEVIRRVDAPEVSS